MDAQSSHLPPLAASGRLALTEAELVAWGERLGKAARPRLVVAIRGDLGAGKTTLAGAICRGFGVAEPITSPTFALVHEYDGARSPVYHLDLYRLKSADELVQLGWDEIVSAEALILIEWPERAGSLLPADHLPIELAHVDDDPHRRVLYAGGHVGERRFGDHA